MGFSRDPVEAHLDVVQFASAKSRGLLGREAQAIGDELDKLKIEYEIKYKGGLAESKSLLVELQPWSMTLYNSYDVLSGGSLLASFNYDLSPNKNYQIALNYRLMEKDDVISTLVESSISICPVTGDFTLN